MSKNFGWKHPNDRENESDKNEYSIEIPNGANGSEPGTGTSKPANDGNIDFKDAEHMKQGEDETQLIVVRPLAYRNNWTIGWRGALLAFIYFFCCATILMFGMNFVHVRMPPPDQVAPLPDLGHELIPKVEPEDVGDIPMMLLIASVVLFIPFQAKRYAIITKFFVTMGNLYLLRIISISVTSLPATDNHCRSDFVPIDNIYLNTLKGIISFGGKNNHCGDLMFSGHTCMATNCWLVWMTNTRKRHPARFISTLVLIGLIIMIIATRSHYTLDIYIALLLTIFVNVLTPSYFPYTSKKIGRWFKKVF